MNTQKVSQLYPVVYHYNYIGVPLILDKEDVTDVTKQKRILGYRAVCITSSESDSFSVTVHTIRCFQDHSPAAENQHHVYNNIIYNSIILKCESCKVGSRRFKHKAQIVELLGVYLAAQNISL